MSKRKGGQQSTYTEWAGETICAGLAEGHSLLSICEAMGISYEAAKRWETDVPEHATNSTRARAIGCHALAEQCLAIADDSERDFAPVVGFDADDDSAPKAFNSEHVQRSKLRIETRMRLIGKWLPKVYGDRTTVAGDPDAPLVQQLTDEQLAARIAALQARLNGKP